MKKISNEEHKKIMLEMLKYIDEICLENDIPYFVFAGTMLGTVRHQGYIPWDDDVDIALVDNDYDRLIELLKSEKKYNLLDYSTSNDYFYPFAKLIDTRTILIENTFNKIEDYGIYIDIFRISGCPVNNEKRFIKKQAFYIKNIFYCNGTKFRKQNLLIRIIRKPLIINAKILGKNRILQKYNKMMEKYKVDNSNYSTFNWNILNYLLPSECFKNIKTKIVRQKFENIEINNLKDFDTILSIQYGDYMKLPPKNKRGTHDCEVYWRNDL